jgi:hypothetical protein
MTTAWRRSPRHRQCLVADDDGNAPSSGEAISSQSEGASLDAPPGPETRGAGLPSWGGVPKRSCWLFWIILRCTTAYPAMGKIRWAILMPTLLLR